MESTFFTSNVTDHLITLSFFENLILFLGFIGSRFFVTKFYDENKTLMDDPYFKLLLIFSVVYSYFKHIYFSAFMCIIYIFFLSN